MVGVGLKKGRPYVPAPSSSKAGHPHAACRGARHADKAAETKHKARGIKELNDAPPLEARVPSLLASVDLDTLLSAASVAKQRSHACYAGALAASPRTQAFVHAHGAQAPMQLGLALVALVALVVMPTSYLPPSLVDTGATRWLELPLGLLLGLKFNDIGSKMWTVCSPVPVAVGRAHG